MSDEPRSIRVNLRFGPRTDPALIDELTQLTPRDRAQWVRAWVTEGWRQGRERARRRVDAPTNPVPSLHEPPQSIVPTVPSRTASAHNPDTRTPALADGVLALIGERIV